GNGPLPKQRGFAALDQSHTAMIDDDRADSDQRAVWIFALHGLAAHDIRLVQKKTAGRIPSRYQIFCQASEFVTQRELHHARLAQRIRVLPKLAECQCEVISG
ncbi:MAG: hypothetical protein JWN45_165, partial [Acidobacteriaceae bacterium]|nr:hypothetical protein [Acidobacteriaceae bacterium]